MAKRVRRGGFRDVRIAQRPGASRAETTGRSDDGGGTIPLRGSCERASAGKTYCQRHSRPAFGHLRASAKGSQTSPSPSASRAREASRAKSSWSRRPWSSAIRKHRDAILEAFAVAHEDLAAIEVHVLHAQPHPFHDPQSRAIEKAADQRVHAAQLGEHARDLRAGQHDRQPHRTPWPARRYRAREARSPAPPGRETAGRPSPGSAWPPRRWPSTRQMGQERLDVRRPSADGCRLPWKRT